ncbi:MAG: YggS family pyridoxal phosphate enzyme, partial [Micrococcus sp.]|nr:YggS family pyridoxal phosphate enzyme [Micrococcus sp.]
MQTSPEMHESIARTLDRLDAAAERAGRDPGDVLVLLATKLRTPAEIRAAVDALREQGRRVAVGENRAQEIAKFEDPLLADLDVPRHFIGRLQTNKAKDAVAFASIIESVDRPSLIDALERRSELAGRTTEVMVQVNTSGEDSKGGFAPDVDAVHEALTLIDESPHLRPVGLMTIGANTPDEADVRASLARLRTLRDDLADERLTEL